MVPRLVPEISSLDAFCDGAGAAGAGAAAAGIGDSRSWIEEYDLALTQCALEWALLCRRRKKRMDLEMLSCKRRHLSLDLDHLRCYSSPIQI